MKMIATIILTFFFIASSAFPVCAKPCPLPDTNTDAEINFDGIEWYSDYSKTLGSAEAKGFISTKARATFEDDVDYTTPHWTTLIEFTNSSEGGEEGCGGYIQYGGLSSIENLPKIGGYDVETLYLYMMWNPKVTMTGDFTQADAVQLYMAKYDFDVTDSEQAYNDLVIKLKKIYGDSPYVNDFGYAFHVDYTLWINEDGACVGVAVSPDWNKLSLLYMAPEAEKKLCAMEELIWFSEALAASGDISGL